MERRHVGVLLSHAAMKRRVRVAVVERVRVVLVELRDAIVMRRERFMNCFQMFLHLSTSYEFDNPENSLLVFAEQPASTRLSDELREKIRRTRVAPAHLGDERIPIEFFASRYFLEP